MDIPRQKVGIVSIIKKQYIYVRDGRKENERHGRWFARHAPDLRQPESAAAEK